MLTNDGNKKILIIRRMRCTNCNHIHHELPDIIVPYKRYDSETIEAIISEKQEHQDDYPCETTTFTRLKLWFHMLSDYLCNTINALIELYKEDSDLRNELSVFIPFFPVSNHAAGWLKHIVRYISNTNRWVQTRFA